MKQKSRSVIWFALIYVVFIVPHVSNLLHYVIIEHQFGVRTNKTEWVNADKVHYCEQYLFKISSALALDIVNWEPFQVQKYFEKIAFRECVALQSAINFYWLRGPPSTLCI